MIERLDKKATIKLLAAMKFQAESDIRLYSKKVAKRRKGSRYIGKRIYESAVYYLNVELPDIKEVISESFRES